MMSFQHMSSDGLKKTSKISFSLEETDQIASLIAKKLQVGSSVCFFGELGSGKTTLIKALAKKLSGIDPHEVNSPTFTYLNIYEGSPPLFHFDLYRLENDQDFLRRGFDEYFDANGICLIEWAERIKPILPKNAVCIELKHLGENTRELTFL